MQLNHILRYWQRHQGCWCSDPCSHLYTLRSSVSDCSSAIPSPCAHRWSQQHTLCVAWGPHAAPPSCAVYPKMVQVLTHHVMKWPSQVLRAIKEGRSRDQRLVPDKNLYLALCKSLHILWSQLPHLQKWGRRSKIIDLQRWKKPHTSAWIQSTF